MEEWRNVSVLKKTACNLLAFHSSCTTVFQHKLGIQWGCMLKSCDQPQLIKVTEMSKQSVEFWGSYLTSLAKPTVFLDLEEVRNKMCAIWRCTLQESCKTLHNFKMFCLVRTDANPWLIRHCSHRTWEYPACTISKARQISLYKNDEYGDAVIIEDDTITHVT